MYTPAFNNEQAAIKAIKENKYEYVREDENCVIETYIANPKKWVTSKSADFNFHYIKY